MRAKIGYMAILVLMGFLYLWTNVAVTFYLFFGLLLFAILSFLLNGYAARHLTMHLQVKQDLNQVSTILICVKNTGIIPCFRVSMKGTIANCLTDSSFCFNQELSVAPKQEKKVEFAVESFYCGRIEVETEEFIVRDFFGIFGCLVKNHEVLVYYVYPDGADEGEYHLEEMTPAAQNMENRYLRRKGNDITEILDLRDYQKGDSIKTIHWKLSKKMGHKIVRELDTPANQETIVLFALSDRNIDKPWYRDSLVKMISQVSKNLLENDQFFDSVVFEKKGLSHMTFSVEEGCTRERYERTILDGNISFMQSFVDDYLMHHNVLHKYSHIILITDDEITDWCMENANVRQIMVSAS